jgi:hypothetical protein
MLTGSQTGDFNSIFGCPGDRNIVNKNVEMAPPRLIGLADGLGVKYEVRNSQNYLYFHGLYGLTLFRFFNSQ